MKASLLDRLDADFARVLGGLAPPVAPADDDEIDPAASRPVNQTEEE